MGAVWSRSQSNAAETAEVKHTNSGAGSKRKRTLESQVADVNTPPHCEESSKLDGTPDGEAHKYIVRCSSVFWCTRKDISKLLGKLKGMPPHGGVHKVTKWDHFFITFPNKACAERGVECLDANTYRGEQWQTSRALEHSAKRMRIDDTVSAGRKVSSNLISEGVCKTAADVTAKWRHIPYTEQIQRKKHRWTEALCMVTKQMKKELKGRDSLPWLNELSVIGKKKNGPACCPLERVIEAESHQERLYYRNKNEFTIGLSPDSCGMNHEFHESQITVGYALGLVRDGTVFVGAVDKDCVTTGELARGVANCLARVIRTLKLPPYDKATHQGYWRQITCREGMRTGQAIVSVVVNPDAITDQDKADGFSDKRCQGSILEALREHFGPDKQFGVFWQPSSHVSAVASDIPAIHIYGIDSLFEEMCGLRFRIQPTAFFQVNTAMAEKLYNLIGAIAQVNSETAVLDVCCGTGTIGLSLARRAHSVVGIELSEAAVADARFNATLNGIENATFIAGKVENRIHQAIQKIEGNRECVVILDPPRAGLPMNVVAAVRGMKRVQRIVYVACAPNNFWKNALGFLRPRSKAFRLEPFRPVKAYGLDLFPHTDHGELAVVLERDSLDGRNDGQT